MRFELNDRVEFVADYSPAKAGNMGRIVDIHTKNPLLVVLLDSGEYAMCRPERVTLIENTGFEPGTHCPRYRYGGSLW